MLTGKRVLHHHRDRRGVAPDTVQDEIHATESRDAVDQFDAAKLLSVEERELFLVELVVIANKLVGDKQETAGATSWIANNACAARTFGRLRLHHIDDCAYEWTWREVLTRAAFHVLGVLLQEAFVSVAFNVRVE